MNQDLQVFEEEPIELAIAPDDDLGVNEQTMPTIAPVMEVQLQPAAMPIAELLPADFRLPALIKFCPNPAVKAAIDQAAAYALKLEVVGTDGLAAADLALAAVNDSLKVADAEFEDAAALANELHKNITGTRAAWKAAGENAKKTLGSRMYAEKTRLDKIAADKRRADQEEANRKAREEAEAAAAEALKKKAPAAVVEKLQEQAKTAVAPPVPVAPAPVAAMKSSTTVTTWKARIKGTLPDEDPNPTIENIPSTQWESIAQLLRDIADGKMPRAAVSLNWSYLNNRAKSDKSTLQITGIEAFAEGSVRAKGSRSR